MNKKSWVPAFAGMSGGWALIVAIMAVAIIGSPANADIVVNVDQGASQPLPIASPRRTADPVHLGRGAPAPVRHGVGRSGRACASASSAAVQLSQ